MQATCARSMRLPVPLISLVDAGLLDADALRRPQPRALSSRSRPCCWPAARPTGAQGPRGPRRARCKGNRRWWVAPSSPREDARTPAAGGATRGRRYVVYNAGMKGVEVNTAGSAASRRRRRVSFWMSSRHAPHRTAALGHSTTRPSPQVRHAKLAVLEPRRRRQRRIQGAILAVARPSLQRDVTPTRAVICWRRRRRVRRARSWSWNRSAGRVVALPSASAAGFTCHGREILCFAQPGGASGTRSLVVLFRF